MGLKKSGRIDISLKLTSILFVLFAFLLVGCGGSEEATTEQQPQGTRKQEPAAKEQPKAAEEKPADQALTSFMGGEPEKTEEQKPAATPAPQLGQYEKQIEDLRTENTGLKQKIVKLEQENRELNARFSETEAKLTAEKDRANKAEELAKNIPPPSKAPTAEPPKPAKEEQPQPPSTEKPVTPASMSAYEEGLKAFNARKYDDAAKGFKAIIDGGANDDLTNRAKYWLGESNFAKKKYKEALPLFQDVLKFKNSEKKADAQFMIAQTYERLGNKAKAKEAYEKVVKDYPMSKNVKRAKERWAKL